MSPNETTAAEKQVLAVLKAGGMTCTQIGETLWHGKSGPNLNRQSYARPAGKIIASLRKKGLVTDHLPGKGFSARKPGDAPKWRLKTP